MAETKILTLKINKYYSKYPTGPHEVDFVLGNRRNKLQFACPSLSLAMFQERGGGYYKVGRGAYYKKQTNNSNGGFIRERERG